MKKVILWALCLSWGIAYGCTFDTDCDAGNFCVRPEIGDVFNGICIQSSDLSISTIPGQPHPIPGCLSNADCTLPSQCSKWGSNTYGICISG